MSQKTLKQQQGFVKNAGILLIAAFVVKIIGALFKIPLTASLGGEGMGYFMSAYSLFSPVYALSVAGFPVAVARLTAAAIATGRYTRRQEVFSTAITVIPLIGFTFSVAMWLLAPYFASLIKNPQAVISVRAISPAIFFCCITSVFKGYFEGAQNMIPTAFAQVAEALSKLFFGLIISSTVLKTAMEQWEASGTVFSTIAETQKQALAIATPYAACGAIVGVAISSFIGALLMMIIYLVKGPNQPCGNKSQYLLPTTKLLLATAMPICASALATNLSTLIDLSTIIPLVAKGANKAPAIFLSSHSYNTNLGEISISQGANFLYGCYSGISMTMFNLAPTVTVAIAVSSMPLIAAIFAQKRKTELALKVNLIIKTAAIIALPMGFGMAAMSAPALAIVFSKNPLETATAALLLRILGIAAAFAGIAVVTTALLNALGRVFVPVRLIITGAVIKLALNLLLISNPAINIFGAAISTTCCYIFITIAGLATLSKSIHGGINFFKVIILPAVCALGCTVCCFFAYNYLENRLNSPINLAFSLFCGALFYILLLIITGVFGKRDLKFITKH